VWQRHQRDLWILAIVVVGLFVALADVGALGPVGRAISRALADLLGIGRFALAIVLLALGVALVWGKIEFDRARASWGVVFGLVSISGIADLAGGRPVFTRPAKSWATTADGSVWRSVVDSQRVSGWRERSSCCSRSW